VISRLVPSPVSSLLIVGGVVPDRSATIRAVSPNSFRSRHYGRGGLCNELAAFSSPTIRGTSRPANSGVRIL
jgi:hypothetical protein